MAFTCQIRRYLPVSTYSKPTTASLKPCKMPAPCWYTKHTSTVTRTAGGIKHRLFSARHRSGLSAWSSRGCAVLRYSKLNRPVGSRTGASSALKKWSPADRTGVFHASVPGAYRSRCLSIKTPVHCILIQLS